MENKENSHSSLQINSSKIKSFYAPFKRRFSSKKTLTLILATLLLITAGIAGFFYAQQEKVTKNEEKNMIKDISSPTPISDPTANWKTYINKKYNFTVKYPPDWFVVFQSDTLFFGEGPHPTSIPPLTHSWPYISISISNTMHSEEALQEVGIKQGATINNETLNKQEHFTTLFDGQKANKKIQLSPDLVEGNTGTTIIFNKDEHGWTIHIPAENYKGDINPTFEKILSTFKFLEEETGDTSDWKTYTNTTYKFSIKLPPDWHYSENDPNYPSIAVVFGPLVNENHVGEIVEPYVSQGLWLEVYPRDNSIDTLDAAADKHLDCGYDSTKDRKYIKIGHKDAIKVNDSPCGLTSTDELLWMGNKNVYMLLTSRGIDQFIPTFSILD